MTNRVFVAGDTVTVLDLERLPAGAQIELTDTGYRLISVPEVESDVEALAWELYRSFIPETVQTRLSRTENGDRWRNVADYVSTNFTRKQQLPDEVTDGDGDTWVLKSNGLYGVSWSSDVGSRTLEEIRERWRIPSEVTSVPRKLLDRDGDTWEQQSDGTYIVRFRQSGELSDLEECTGRTEQQVRDEWSPVTVVS